MLLRSPFLFFFLLMFPALSARAAGLSPDTLTILTPPDKTYVESELLSIVLVAPKDAFDAVSITVNRREYPRLRKRGDYYVCTGVTLSEGDNRIKVTGLRDGKAVAGREIEVFYRLDLSDKYSVAPPGFRRYYFHTEANEKNCIFCHQLGKEASGDGSQSPCMPCHKRLADYKYVHGPASVSSCQPCHSGGSQGVKNSVPKPYSKVCSECHNDTMETWDSMENRHGPYSLGNCTLCHNPHGSDYPFFTRKHTTDLCTTCHEDKASGSHVVTSFAGRGHPVRGKADPLNPGKELTCASCHNPHASKFTHLLFQDETDINKFCKACHRF